ncbi:MAG: Fur family transcriptional regulator, partial [Syntrophomonadaceae bacterium]|nr:Fur family transcriptional regulator [Syntrophomonadaceae bacterium]
MKYLEPYIEQLKQAGYKVTHQRLVILDYLLHSKDHPSAEAIYADLRQRYPTISLATVYNTLEMLAKVGLVIDLGAPGERRRFDGNMTDHSHYFCTSCGRVTDLHIPGAERTIN